MESHRAESITRQSSNPFFKKLVVCIWSSLTVTLRKALNLKMDSTCQDSRLISTGSCFVAIHVYELAT